MTHRQNEHPDLPREEEIDLTPSRLSAQKNVVRVFYKDLWDKADLGLIPTIFHPDFTFRGSLGPVLVGHRQFGEYVSWLTETLEDYTSDILELVEEGDRVSGKLRFHGIHRRTMFGEAPTGRRSGGTARPSSRSTVRSLAICGCSATSTAYSRVSPRQKREASASTDAKAGRCPGRISRSLSRSTRARPGWDARRPRCRGWCPCPSPAGRPA